MYPNITEYIAAIKNASDNFDKLVHLRPVLDNLGEPLRSVGGFAVVFKMEDIDTGRFYAVKCFHEDQNDRATSYEEIGKIISANKSS